MTAATDALFGRERELGLIDELIGQVHDRGGALVVSGEPGIGKSALLAAARIRARDRGMRLLHATGVQSEARLAFAGLHQLLQPALDDIDKLHGPQRDALLSAFGMIDATAPDLFLTALAALDLLCEASTDSPVLVIAEDAQWLDRSTADVLAFVARRLEYEPILLLAATRDGFDGPLQEAALPALALDPLDPAAARALLQRSAPEISAAARRQVLEEAAGNPLALVELPIAFGHLDGRARAPLWLPLTTRLERAFAARLHDLPVATRTALLVAALNDSTSLREALTASTRLIGPELNVDALVPAVTARLVELDESDITFRHPLMRAAIAQQASISQRHAGHAALAAVLGEQPERRVWHRAASVIGPDEAVAAELEAASEQAQRRGASAIAASALERAAKLSDPSHRTERLLRAAELGFEMGRRELVLQLLRETAGLRLGELERAKVTWIRESFSDGIPGDPEQARSLAAIAGRAADDGDSALALKLLNRAALRCWWADPGALAHDDVVAAAQRLDVDESDPRLLAILAFAAPIQQGATVIARLSNLPGHLGDAPGAARLLGTAATAVGAFGPAAVFLATSINGLRAQGRLGLLARALTLYAWSVAQLVDLNAGIPAAEEAAALARETHQPVILATATATQAIFAALRGEAQQAETLATEVEQSAMPIGASGVLAAIQLARGRAALGERRYTEAVDHLRRLYDPSDPAYHVAIRCFAIADLAEATLHSRQRALGRRFLDEMEAVARQTPSPALHADLRYARPLLAEDDVAEPLFKAALHADIGATRILRARAQLAYGEWLRQRRRSVEARGLLRAARETFDALGTIPWSDRARQQLRATGESSHRRTPEARDQLTPQELQIAQLVAKGMTNREIGQMLYLSHRTISSHLYRAFPKLGITSRAELRDLLEHPIATPA
ncbi:MAG: helix-turn-helix transcriptional regulator [Solirubrobacteraceae bacterium]